MTGPSEQPQEVNIKAGDEASEYFAEQVKKTWEIRPDALDVDGLEFGHSALIDGDYFLGKGSLSYGHQLDGIGTKPEVRERLNDHFGAAQDLYAMVGDDVAPTGGELISIDNILDVREINPGKPDIDSGIRQLADGLVLASHLAGAIALTGEIAELGKRIGGYGDFNYNWSGVAFFAVNKERRLTGRELKPGQALVGLVEPGFRSNGITDVRNAMFEHYGPEWHTQIEPSLGSISLGELVQTPAMIYAKLMRDLQGGFDINKEPLADITGVAHITGGGQPSKIGRMLKRTNNLGVVIDNPITPPDMMLHVQKLRGFDDKKAYGKWHMGPGMVVATTMPEVITAAASAYGIKAQKIGYITDQPGIRIKNMGAAQDEEWLRF